jgi:hypothetical protein
MRTPGCKRPMWLMMACLSDLSWAWKAFVRNRRLSSIDGAILSKHGWRSRYVKLARCTCCIVLVFFQLGYCFCSSNVQSEELGLSIVSLEALERAPEGSKKRVVYRNLWCLFGGLLLLGSWLPRTDLLRLRRGSLGHCCGRLLSPFTSPIEVLRTNDHPRGRSCSLPRLVARFARSPTSGLLRCCRAPSQTCANVWLRRTQRAKEPLQGCF